MAVCPVCGCKTEELDFVERKITDVNCKVCSFCSRQLNVFDGGAEPTEAQLRWLTAVIGKEVSERDESILKALESVRSRFSEEKIASAIPAQQKTATVPQGTVKKSKADYDEDDIILELRNRITALENEIRTMKRKQMIKTIIELGAPFALLILLIIVLLSSGLIDNVKAIFDMAGVSL